MLDYDGTLAPFRPERDLAVPYPGIEERLERLIASETTRVIIVSGRAIDDLKPLLKLNKLPEIWGSHGWERLDAAGQYRLGRVDPEPAAGLKKARELVTVNNLEQYLEVKPVSLAIHRRDVAEDKVVEIERIIVDNWDRLADEYDLVLDNFDGGWELKVPGSTKGDVVGRILGEHSPDTPAAYLGDDLTDEDAFRALPPTALGILVRTEPRPSAASVHITPPVELLEFLDRWINLERRT